MTTASKHYELENMSFSEYSSLNEEFSCHSAKVEYNKEAVIKAIEAANQAYALMQLPFDLHLEKHINVTLQDEAGEELEDTYHSDIEATVYISSAQANPDTAIIWIKCRSKYDSSDCLTLGLCLSE